MPRLQVERRPRPAHVGRHRADVTQPVLTPDRPHLHHPGDLGDRVRLVRRLQPPGQQLILGQRLRGVLRVDRAGGQKQQPTHPVPHHRAQQVHLHQQVLPQDLAGKSVFAPIPPTRPLASTIATDATDATEASTSTADNNSRSAWMAPTTGRPCAVAARTSAEPTSPRWPASYSRQRRHA